MAVVIPGTSPVKRSVEGNYRVLYSPGIKLAGKFESVIIYGGRYYQCRVGKKTDEFLSSF